MNCCNDGFEKELLWGFHLDLKFIKEPCIFYGEQPVRASRSERSQKSADV